MSSSLSSGDSRIFSKGRFIKIIIGTTVQTCYYWDLDNFELREHLL